MRAPDEVAGDQSDERRRQHEDIVAGKDDQRLRAQPGAAGRGRQQGADTHDEGKCERDPPVGLERTSPMRGNQRRPHQCHDGNTMHVRAANSPQMHRHERDRERGEPIADVLEPEEPRHGHGGMVAGGTIHAVERQRYHDAIEEKQPERRVRIRHEAHEHVERRERRPDVEAKSHCARDRPTRRAIVCRRDNDGRCTDHERPRLKGRSRRCTGLPPEQ